MQRTMCGVLKARPEPGAEYRTDLPIPRVGPRDVLVNVKAAAICGTDQHILPWTPYAQERVPTPMVFGHEFSGEIVAVGEQVREFAVGDRVAGETHIPCNKCYQCETGNRHICENMKIIGVQAPGAFAQYISFPADCAYRFNDSLSYQHAAMLEPMGVAVHGVDKGDVEGKDVIIYGCGPIGLMAVGAAKVFGAKTITAIDIFDPKLEVAVKMGADYIINSKESDPVAQVHQRVAHGVDVVIDYTGNPHAINTGFDMLRKGGRYVMVGLPSSDILFSFTNKVIYKEATVIGVTGRLMYKTWEQCEQVLADPRFNFEMVVGGVYKLKDYGMAFQAIADGAPGKMLLIPD